MARSGGNEELNLIAQGTIIDGKLTTTGTLRVDGKVNGDVAAGEGIVIGSSGEIEGNISAQSLSVGGKFLGNAAIEGKLVLQSTARVRGDIKASVLVIDEGAVYDGNCSMTKDLAKVTTGAPVKPPIIVQAPAQDQAAERELKRHSSKSQ